MKKIILGLTIISTISAFAQKNKVVSAYNYNKAFTRSGNCSEVQKGLEAINASIEHDQTKNWAKTWYYRGDLYYAILASNDQACKSIDANALEKCVDSYLKALVLNFQDPELKKLDLGKEDGSDIPKFNAARKNRSKMDDETYTSDIIGRKLPGLSGEYANKGITEFSAKNYKGAQESFSRSMLLSSFSGKMDTMLIYNTALAAEYGENYDVAKRKYDELINLGYNIDGNGPSLYASMARIYKKEGDEAKALSYIQEGRKAYPNDNNLLVAELDYYLQSGKHEESLKNLNLAIENDGNNAILYFARGTVHESLKQGENAINDYKKAIEIQPDYYDANFNLGAYYFNSAADKINEANKLDLKETKKFNALKEEAKALFTNSVPYIEAANKAKPEDVGTANMLIKVYTQTGQYDKAKETKAKYQ